MNEVHLFLGFIVLCHHSVVNCCKNGLYDILISYNAFCRVFYAEYLYADVLVIYFRSCLGRDDHEICINIKISNLQTLAIFVSQTDNNNVSQKYAKSGITTIMLPYACWAWYFVCMVFVISASLSSRPNSAF